MADQARTQDQEGQLASQTEEVATDEQSAGAKDRVVDANRAAGDAAVERMAGDGGGDGKEKKPEEEKAAQIKAYEEMLGHALGPKLYALVAENTTPDKLLGYSQSIVDALIGAGCEHVTGIEGQAGDGQVAILEGILKEKARALLQSDTGKAIAQKISKYIDENPKEFIVEVLATVLLAAAAAVAANLTIPEIKQKFSLGGGFSAEIDAKLGKVRAIALEKLEGKLAYQRGLFNVELSGGHNDKGNFVGGKLAYGDESNNIYTSGLLDEQGVLHVNLGGTAGKFSGSAGSTSQGNDLLGANAQLSYGDKEFKLTSGVDYDEKTGALKLNLGQEIHRDIYTHLQTVNVTQDQNGTQATTTTTDRAGNERDFVEITRQQQQEGEQNVSVNAQRTLGNTVLTGGMTQEGDDISGRAGLKYTKKDFALMLDGTFKAGASTLSGSVEGHPTANTLLRANASFDISRGNLASIGLAFGWTDPDEFRSFLLDYKHTNAPDATVDDFFTRVELTMGPVMARLENQTTLRDGALSSGHAGAMVAVPLNRDYSLLAGLQAGYGPQRDMGWKPEVGVQFNKQKIAVVGGYDTRTESFGVRLVMYFGR